VQESAQEYDQVLDAMLQGLKEGYGSEFDEVLDIIAIKRGY